MPVFFIPFSYLFCIFPAAVTVTATRIFCDPDRIRIVAFPFLRAVTTPKADTVTILQSGSQKMRVAVTVTAAGKIQKR